MRNYQWLSLAAVLALGLIGCGKEEPPAPAAAPAAPEAPAPVAEAAPEATETSDDDAEPAAAPAAAPADGSPAPAAPAPGPARKTPDQRATEAFAQIRDHIESNKLELAVDALNKVEAYSSKLSDFNMNQIAVLRAEIETKRAGNQ